MNVLIKNYGGQSKTTRGMDEQVQRLLSNLCFFFWNERYSNHVMHKTISVSFLVEAWARPGWSLF